FELKLGLRQRDRRALPYRNPRPRRERASGQLGGRGTSAGSRGDRPEPRSRHLLPRAGQPPAGGRRASRTPISEDSHLEVSNLEGSCYGVMEEDPPAAGPPRSIWAQLDTLQAPRQRTGEPGRYVVEASWDGISGTEKTTEAKISSDPEEEGMEDRCLVRQQLLLRAHPSAHTVLLRVLRVDGEPGPGAALVGELRLDAANLGAADWHALAGGSGGSDGRIRLCLVAPRTGPGTDEEHAAATRIQARLRGKQARKTVLLMKGIPADPAQAPRSSARAPTRGADGHDERAAPDPARALRGSAAQAPAQDLDEDDTPQASTRTPAHAASDPARASRGSARAPSGAGVRFGPDSGGEAAAGASTRPRAEAASGPARAGRSSARHTRLEGVDDGDAGAEGGAFEQMLADLFQELDEARAGRLGVDAMFELRVLRGGPEDWETFQRAWGSACEA
ncbi:unnamed protein product, partial [Prorocentrum cordatum]